MKNYKFTVVFMLIAILLLITACSGKKDDDYTDEQISTKGTSDRQPTVTENQETTNQETTDADPTDGESKVTAESTNEEQTETEVENPELVWSVKHENELESIAVSPSEQTVTVGEFMTAYTYRLADGELVDVFLFNHSAEDMEFSPGGEILGAGLGAYGAVLTDVNSGKEISQLHTGYNNRVAFSPNEGIIATGNRKGVVWLWMTDNGEQMSVLEAPEVKWVTSIDFHPSGTLLAAAQTVDDGCVHIWDVEEKRIIHNLKFNSLFEIIENPFQFSPDGIIMAGAVKKDFKEYISLWTVDEAELIVDLPISKNFRDMDFSPDGSMLAVTTKDTTTIWDISTHKLLYTLEQTSDGSVNDRMKEVAFTPDGGHIAVIRNDGTLELWRLPGVEPIVAPPIDMRKPPALPSDVLFDTGSATLKEEAYTELEKFAEELSDNFKIATITFIGHTDSRGSEEDNLQLSLERALAIKTWFKKWADSKETVRWELLIDGLGESELKVPDTDVEGNFLEGAGTLNRRVEVEIEVSN
jgi:WD40 repeat protein